MAPWWLALTGVVACHSPEVKQCIAQYDSAQRVVRDVKGESIDSVEASVAAIDAAIELCRKAERHDEVDNLTTARQTLAAHLDALNRRANRPKAAPESPEQLALLEKKGDPRCPAGQGYKHRKTGKEIRCAGPQLIEMGWNQAKEYLGQRAYSVKTDEARSELRAEYGAELFVFRYAKPGDATGPRCLTLYPAPGTSWQEAVARATGARPDKLKPGTPVKTSLGPRQLAVDEGENKLVIRLGECSA